MVSDDERRRIAERLRGLRRGANNVTQLNHGPTWSLAWCVLGDGLDECGTGDWFERMCARLADLIYPGDMSQGRRDIVACDRDALLALADRMEEMSGMGALLTAGGLEKASASIREALGASDD